MYLSASGRFSVADPAALRAELSGRQLTVKNPPCIAAPPSTPTAIA